MTDKRFIAHIATEIVLLFGIVLFFFRQKQRLEHRIAQLEDAVRKMHETLESMARINTAPVVVEQPPVNYFPQRRNAVVFATNICSDRMCEIANSQNATGSVQEVPFEELISTEDLSLQAIDNEIAEELSELQISATEKKSDD